MKYLEIRSNVQDLYTENHKNIAEKNDNENTTIQNLWGAAKEF